MKRAHVSTRRWLILPVETKARELHAKLLLGFTAAERGWGVVIGKKEATRGIASQLPYGTFLEKSMQPGPQSVFREPRNAGHRVSILCEEGLLYLSKDDYNERRISAEGTDEIDFFFAWGANQAADIERIRDQVVVTGSPRMDLLQREWRGVLERGARAIRERYGRIILINTKFSTVNHGLAEMSDVVSLMKEHGRIKSQQTELLWRRYVELMGRLFPLFIEALRRLSREFPEHSVIVRPHPSELDETWANAAHGLPNVHVIYESSANEWMLAADVSIQNNCQTGIEAFLLEKPVISYRPVADDDVEYGLVHSIGLEAVTEDELIGSVRRVLNREIDFDSLYESQRDTVRPYIANTDAASACTQIMDAFETLDLPSSSAEFPIRRSVERRLVSLIKRLSFMTALRAYTWRKFPTVEYDEVVRFLQDARRLSGRFSELRIVPVTHNGFCIYKP